MNINLKRILLLSLILAIGSLAMLSTASAASTHVLSNNLTSSTLQMLFNNYINDGDTVNFSTNGNYNNINININKSVKINGNGATLNCRVNNDPICNITKDNVTICNMTLNGIIIATGVKNLTIKENTLKVNFPKNSKFPFLKIK